MYTPKLHEDLVPRLYELAKTLGQPMTAVLNAIVRQALDRLSEKPKVRMTGVTPFRPPRG